MKEVSHGENYFKYFRKVKLSKFYIEICDLSIVIALYEDKTDLNRTYNFAETLL